MIPLTDGGRDREKLSTVKNRIDTVQHDIRTKRNWQCTGQVSVFHIDRETWPQLAANRDAWRETVRLGYPAICQS